MKTCATCNASHKNTVERVLRCMGCVAKPSGNSNWRPLVPNKKCTKRDPAGKQVQTTLLGKVCAQHGRGEVISIIPYNLITEAWCHGFRILGAYVQDGTYTLEKL